MKKYEEIKKENIFDKIMLILFCIGLFISSIVVGVPFELWSNTQFISLYFSVLTLIYFVHILVRKRYCDLKIKGIDICVGLFCLTPIIPLISRTYISTSGTIAHIVMYLNIFNIYFLSRTVTTLNKNAIKYILGTIIASAVFMVIYGIDNMTLNIFQKLIGDASYFYYDNRELRAEGFFKYANTFAIYMAFAYFISLYKLIENKTTKLKTVYSIVGLILTYGLVLAISRLTTILFIIAVVFLIIITKEKKDKISIMYSIAFDVCLALITANYTLQLIYTGNIILIYFILIISIVIKAIFINISIKKVPENIMIAGISSTTIIVIFLLLAVNLSSNLTMFTTKYSTNIVKRDVLGINPNTNYKIKFDIDTYSTNNNYKIEIIEKDANYIDVDTHIIKFDTYKGKKEIDFTTKEKTSLFYVCFESVKPENNGYFKVNTMKINGKAKEINYALIPESFLNRSLDINVKTKGVSQRKEFILDALELIKNNWICGIGGNGWQYAYKNVQKTDYATTETHSYLTKITLEFGAISLILYLTILIIFVKNNIKNTRYIAVFIGLSILIVHSFLDINMSYMYILILVFSMIGIFTSANEESKDVLQNNKSKIINNSLKIIVLFIIVTTVIFNFTSSVSKAICLKNVTDYDKKISMYRSANKWAPYEKYYLLQKIRLEQSFKNLNNKEELEQDLLKLYKLEPELKNKLNIFE